MAPSKTEELLHWLTPPANGQPAITGERASPYTRCQGRWRKRPNHEIEYLRQQVADLEAELAVLRQPDSLPSDLVTALTETADQSWEAIAARQRSRADAALLENTKLRAMLEGQLCVARTLENVIDQHMRERTGKVFWSSRDVGRPCASELSDELLFGLLDDNIESIYAATDKAMEASGIAGVAHRSCPKLRVEHSARGVSFHHGEVRSMPFSVSSVLCALCNCISHGKTGGPVKSVAKLVQRGNYTHATILDRLHLPRAREVRVKTRVVQRHFVEARRSVVVWAAYVEIDGSVFVRLEERGWAAIEPYEFRRKRGNGVPGARLRAAVRVTPIGLTTEELQLQHVEDTIDLVIGTYHHNFGLYNQIIENLLMDDVLRVSSTAV